MVRKNFSDNQIVQDLIERRAKVLERVLGIRINSMLASPRQRTFATNTSVFGEFQQGVSVGFCKHYTRRS